MTDLELLERAFKKYNRSGVVDRPSPGLSEVIWLRDDVAVVVLENVNGIIARYRYDRPHNSLRDVVEPDFST